MEQDVFGNIFNITDEDKINLEKIHKDIDVFGLSDELLIQEREAHTLLDKPLHTQSIFLYDRARIKWLEEGDKNSKFFHAMINFRRTKSFLNSLKIDGDMVDILLLLLAISMSSIKFVQ